MCFVNLDGAVLLVLRSFVLFINRWQLVKVLKFCNGSGIINTGLIVYDIEMEFFLSFFIRTNICYKNFGLV